MLRRAVALYVPRFSPPQRRVRMAAQEPSSPPASHVAGPSYRVRGLLLTEHRFTVPLNHALQSGELTVFAREVTAADKPPTPTSQWLVFLQGGPGFEAPRPSESGGWLKAACDKGFRVLLVDQRGTGLSTRVSAASLSRLSDAAAAERLSLFRAPDIVADCEAIRLALNVDKWTLLGQSFGGFCCLTYLSFFPCGVREALITGGLAPRVAVAGGAESSDACYAKLFPRMLTQSAKYYARFPGDAELVRRVVLHLAAQPGEAVALPTCGRLSPRGLQLLGWGFGGAGGMEAVHYLLESAFETDVASGGGEAGPERLSLAFLRGYEATLPFDTNPLYALIHEACYASGSGVGTNWAAQRIRSRPDVAPLFDAVALASSGADVPFTGEVVFPWLFEDVASLRPLAGVAQLLAEKSDWAPLYDAHQLRANTVGVAATAYFEDLYVDFDLAQETLRQVNGARCWVTNEFLHSGVREDGSRVFNTLLAMARDEDPVR